MQLFEMLRKDSMGMGPVTAEGSIAIILILANETIRRARWPVSIEHTRHIQDISFYMYNIERCMH